MGSLLYPERIYRWVHLMQAVETAQLNRPCLWWELYRLATGEECLWGREHATLGLSRDSVCEFHPAATGGQLP